MTMTVELKSVGNPDFGQDPGRPMPGVPQKRVEVADLADASKVCRAYIAEYELGGGNWNGGLVFEGGLKAKKGEPLGRVAYNGAIFTEPMAMNSKPLYDPRPPAPEGKTEDPLDKFKWDEKIISVPGYGEIRTSGCYRHTVVQSVPGKFKIKGVPQEFIAGVLVDHDGYNGIRDLSFHPKGIYDQTTDDKTALAAVKSAVKEFYVGEEGLAFLLRNTLKDEERQLFVLDRNIGYTETKLQGQRDEAEAQRLKVEAVRADVEALDAPSPRM